MTEKVKSFEEFRQELRDCVRYHVFRETNPSISASLPEEIQYLERSMSVGFLISCLLGSVNGALRKAKVYRAEHSHLLPFKTRSEAFNYIRQSNYQVMLETMKCGFKYGILGALFFGAYTGTEILSQLLREKKDPWNGTYAGSVMGIILGISSPTFRYKKLFKAIVIGSTIGYLCNWIQPSIQNPNSTSKSIVKTLPIDSSQILLDHLETQLKNR
jgi:hypothetical protein